jgi:hypothetical protein
VSDYEWLKVEVKLERQVYAVKVIPDYGSDEQGWKSMVAKLRTDLLASRLAHCYFLELQSPLLE